MKLTTCLVLTLNVLWITSVVSVDPIIPDILKPIDDNAKIKLETQKLAESILIEVNADRHADLKTKIDAMTDSSLKKIQTDLVDKYDGVIKVRDKVKTIKQMTTAEMKKALWKYITGNIKDLDTIAVMHSKKGGFLVVAGNIQTLDIPDLSNRDLWADGLFHEVYGKHDFQYKAKYKDFGLGDSDLEAISRALKNSKNLALNDRSVFIATPKIDPSVVSPEDSHVIKTLPDKIKVAQNEVGFLRKKSTSPGGLTPKELNQLNNHQKHINKWEYELSRAKSNLNRLTHAEMQLRNLKDRRSEFSLGRDSDIVISPSKPACKNCDDILTKDKSVDLTKGEKFFGKRKSNPDPKRWQNKFDVVAKPVFEDIKIPESPDLAGSCSKSSKGCVFVVTQDNSVAGRTKIREIQSDEFLKKYADADIHTRKAITDAVVANQNKLVGSPENQRKVKKVIDYEKLQRTKASMDHSTEVLKTGDFYDSNTKSQFSSEELLSRTKLSRTKTVKALNSKTVKISTKVAKVTGAVGTYMLAKGVIKAINRGDTTSLEIIGGRVGGELALRALGHFGAKAVARMGTKLGIKAAATVASKGLTFLGKAAGPLGGLADIGLSAWGLSNAVKRLKDPNANKFQQNEAIADIVQESVDIAVTATLTVASVILPPLAPLFAVVGFLVNWFVSFAVSIYKAHNHVNSLDSEIQLLGYERDVEFNRYYHGKDTSTYLKDLIKVKTANNLIVNATLDFLDQNPDLIGNIFPSRTFSVKGACKYIKKKWKWYLFKWHLLSTEVIAHCWSEGGNCQGYAGKCVTWTKVWAPWSQDEYKCQCEGDVTTTFGAEHLNSMVDFRQKRYIYLERSIPTISVNFRSYEYLCRPSSTNFGGVEISSESRSFGYNCENAIAIQRTPKSGKFLLFNLGTGYDQVYLNPEDKTNNQFVVDEGKKMFYGSAGSDTFSVVGKCSNLEGDIDGGSSGEDNVLTLNNSCVAGKNLTIDLQGSVMKSGYQVNMRILNLQMLYGRSGERDEIQAGCKSKLIDGRGGKSSLFPDIINVPELNCDLKLSITASNYTRVNLAHSTGIVGVSIPRSEKGLEFFHLVHSATNSTSYVFKTPCRLLTNVSINSDSNETVQLGLTFETGQKATFALLSDADLTPTIILEEDNDGLFSSLNYDEEWTPRVIHRLETKDREQRLRRGTNAFSNYFVCSEGNWSLFGGEYNDDFMLMSNLFTGLIDGGEGVDTLYMDKNLNDTVVNLVDGLATSGENGTNILIRNLNRVIGRTAMTDHIICRCDAAYVAGGGGYSEDEPDIVIITGECDRKDSQLTVVATGFTQVNSNMTQGNLVLVVPPEANSTLSATLTISNSSTTFYFKSSITSLQSFLSNSTLDRCQIETQFNESQRITIDVTSVELVETEDTWLQPVVLFEEFDGPPSRILVNKATGSPLALHQLDLENGTNLERTGCSFIPNYFQFRSGEWRIKGGNKDDVFQVFEPLNGSVTGGNGINSLYLDDEIDSDVVAIDGSLGEVSYGDSEKLIFSNVHKIYGRTNQSDEFISGCQTTFVSLNGGTADSPDLIHLTELVNCDETVQVISTGHTKLTSQNNAVDFEAHILPTDNGEINFKANFHLSGKRVIALHVDIADLLALDSSAKLVGQMKHYSANLKIAGSSENVVSLDFTADEKSTSSPYLPSPQISVLGKNNEMQGTLLLSSSDGTAIMMHILDSQAINIKREGSNFLSNIFYLVSGSWASVGGSRDDTFLLEGSDFSGYINGNNGSNTLIISENITADYIQIDLKNKEIKGLPKKIYVDNIQNIQGRSDKFDQIVCSCDTKVVNGQSGDEHHADEVTIAYCSESTVLSVTVPQRTSVVNSRDQGNFTYVILDDNYFDISANHSVNGYHLYQFKLNTSRIADLKFDQLNQSLNLKFASNKILNLALTGVNEENSEFTKPVVQIEETEAVVAEIRVKKSGFVYSSVSIKKPSSQNVHGIASVVNEFSINVGPSARLESSVYGGKEDDNFWLESASFIEKLDGSAGTNTLVLLPQLHPDKPLFVDLREKSGEIRLDNETWLIKSVENIQIFRGRPKAYELVIASCNTKYVSSGDEIWFADYECPDYDVGLEVGPETIVSFSGDSGLFERVYAGGSFYYNFETLRSFDPYFDFWFTIRNTLQVYYLKFTISDLEAISFSESASKVRYVISNQTYEHSVDKYLELDQQFYAQPQLMSADGFHIQITRDGGVFLTLANPDTDMSLEEIQKDFVSKFGEVANNLNVTIIARTKSDFVYIGNRGDGGTNVLTNTDSRSHLVGGGGSNVNYLILDLKADVYIYTGLEEGSNETQMVDLTEVVWKIRNETNTKYLPRLVETVEGHLEISIDDFKSVYPGKVLIMDGAKNAHQLKFLFNAVAMQLDILARNRRSTEDGERPWNLKPTPIVISEDTLSVISPDDFEYGQEIVVSEGNDSVTLDTNSFQFVRKDNELILTNMGANVSGVGSLMFFDFFNEDEARSSDMLQDLKIKLGDRVFEMNFSDSQVANDLEVADFDELLERTEETMLEDLPEIRRQFIIPTHKKWWKKHKDLFIGLIAAGSLLFVASLIVVSLFRRSKRKAKHVINRSHHSPADAIRY